MDHMDVAQDIKSSSFFANNVLNTSYVLVITIIEFIF